MQSEDKDRLQTLQRALKVMEFLSQTKQQGASVLEIARECGLARPVVYRVLDTLADGGYVYRDEHDRFRLGVALLRLAASYLAGFDLASASTAELEHLRDSTGATATLYVRSNAQRVCIRRIYGPHASRMIHIGDAFPLHNGASGKVILAFDPDAPESELRLVPPDLLAAIRTRGWAVTLGERDTGIGAVSAPVWRGKQFMGAVSLSLPVHMMADGRHEGFLGSLLEHTRRLSDQLLFL